MSIRREDVLHVARLAELEVAEGELSRLVEQMGRIVEFVAQLNEVPASEQAPAFLAGPAAVRLRPDEVAPDRLAHGAVVDFALLHITTASFAFNWYVFNLADVAIVAGVAGLLYETLLGGRAAKAP